MIARTSFPSKRITVQVKDLVPNPYYNMAMIDRKKVEYLKYSIHLSGFWDNLLARQVNDKYEIAYGHCRLIALQELDVKEIQLQVRHIDDSAMIKIMANENMELRHIDDSARIQIIANENMEDWQSHPNTFVLDVKAVRDYLNAQRQDGDAEIDVTAIVQFFKGSISHVQIRKALEKIQDHENNHPL